ncbi:hypothetical protein CWB41_10520 [Methylovirgula ligni]|uniref:Glycosyl transferase family 1 n=1 Tax=Methylovirgula ligni TaxID=569860 RepID=A0A3D9YUC3_9HYPH|nr:hypothetical protein [Methylovirgula ligni]QAY96109.1 hypothetical protein CWB41_10520 [Methylovirgula ligni]REF86207.1 hypothetical protein DES32_2255 [Methylovirgula ligni]
MRIVYFVSSTHRYDEAIYFGVGPKFGAAYGWEVQSIRGIASCLCDVGIIDNRLEPLDVIALESFLALPPRSRFPIFFRISDPDMPVSKKPGVKFIFACGDRDGVHFATTYDPEGPFKDYVAGLKHSRIVNLPYPYETAREVEIDLTQRRRRVFLSGASDEQLYPLRQLLRRKCRHNPLLRIATHDLHHPGYPDSGARLKHSVVREKFVGYAAAYTHFFLCPTRYESELAKYLECAYAGSVPIGLPPKSLAADVKNCFLTWRGTTWEIVHALASDLDGMQLLASQYRTVLRKVREPASLVRNLQKQIAASL